MTPDRHRSTGRGESVAQPAPSGDQGNPLGGESSAGRSGPPTSTPTAVEGDTATPKVAAPLATRLPLPVRRFLANESAGAIVLLATALTALAWANSPWHESYETLWHTRTALSIGSLTFGMDLHQVVNDGLMTLFFFVVGLEIKRELVDGDLRDPRTAALPAFAAAGGMLIPAALFALVNFGSAGSHGWGIPMATDIAFALGVVSLFGRRLPNGLRLFLLTLAIVDDIGAIVVIAVFYSGDLDVGALVGAAVLLGLVVMIRRGGALQVPIYAVLGTGVWFLTFQSGVHATIAGVVLGLLTPATPFAPAQIAREWAADLDDEPTAGDITAMTALARSSVSPAERLQHRLHPVTSFVVVPLFALANAGVRVDTEMLSRPGAGRVITGVIVGLVAGKILGITSFTWLAVRLRGGHLPPGVSWGQMVGIAGVAGIGFTVSLFISDLAFDGQPNLQSAAKFGVLVASLLAALLGSAVLVASVRSAPAEDLSSPTSPVES